MEKNFAFNTIRKRLGWMVIGLVLALLISIWIHSTTQDPGWITTPSEWLFLACFTASSVWVFITYLAVIDQEAYVKQQVIRLRDQVSGTEHCLVYEHRWSEELAYEEVQQYGKGEGGLFADGMRQDRVLDYAMKFMARRLWEASEEADLALQMQGRDSVDHQKANDTFKRFFDKYWEMANLLSEMFGRPKKLSWKQDLPQDLIKEAEEKKRS